jgi:hypothetical protein
MPICAHQQAPTAQQGHGRRSFRYRMRHIWSVPKVMSASEFIRVKRILTLQDFCVRCYGFFAIILGASDAPSASCAAVFGDIPDRPAVGMWRVLTTGASSPFVKFIVGKFVLVLSPARARHPSSAKTPGPEQVGSLSGPVFLSAAYRRAIPRVSRKLLSGPAVEEAVTDLDVGCSI